MADNETKDDEPKEAEGAPGEGTTTSEEVNRDRETNEGVPDEVAGAERYPGERGGFVNQEPRELAERTDEERDLINQGHTIDHALKEGDGPDERG